MSAVQVVEPGVYDLTEAAYHADPVPGGSLSSSGARRLLPPSCPARFVYELAYGQRRLPEFDFGSAAHLRVLGAGPELEVVEADSWRTKAAQAQRDAAHERGAIPLLAQDAKRVDRMAGALREHPIASAVFNPAKGSAEQSLFWADDVSGQWLRARLDWLPEPVAGRRLIVGDYKTTKDASLAGLQKAVHEYGYHQQAAWYLDGVKALGLAGDLEPAFVFVFQEKTAPYLVTVIELDATALKIGRARNRRAIDLYAECKRTGIWPAYADGVHHLSLPAWAEARELEMLNV